MVSSSDTIFFAANCLATSSLVSVDFFHSSVSASLKFVTTDLGTPSISGIIFLKDIPFAVSISHTLD
jgi:hypothetical protein